MEKNVDFYELGKRFASEILKVYDEKANEIEEKFGKEARNLFETGYIAKLDEHRNRRDNELEEVEDIFGIETDEEIISDYIENYSNDDGYGEY